MADNAHPQIEMTARRARRGRLAVTLVALAAIAVAGLGSGADAQAKALRKGDRGPKVERLQRLLGIPADGLFGSRTVKAVRKFQRRHNLTADGLAGASTLRALRASRHHRRGGSTKSRVKKIQRALGVTADGAFGPGTQRAVKRFQRSRGLTADGIVGAATWRALGLGTLKGKALRRSGKRSSGRAPAGVPARVARMIRAANRIARLPYVYGGGHGSFRASGYDCSGSVSYVLHAGGLLRTPRDSSGFESYGRPGRGRYITIYANGGHAFMTINGRRFDTSGMDDGTRWDRRARSASGYVVRHPAGF